jgi:hypothetical protein
MEYVTVTFPTARQVLINGKQSGMTNQILHVQRGTHVFTLEGDQNYSPASHRVALGYTSSIAPREIVFEKIS